MYNLINYLDPVLAKEYLMERFRESGDSTEKPKVEFEFKPPVFNIPKEKINLPKVSSLPDDHIAKAYCLKRKIPSEALSKLYYAEDFKAFIDELIPEHEKELKSNDPRLIIPFFDEFGDLCAVQGRTLNNSKIRYITMKINKDGIKLFGLDKVKRSEKIHVLEGPIDSLFLGNAVATADAYLQAASRYLPKDKMVLVFDNEPRNKDLCKIIDEAIDQHYNVCIWPEMVQEKDINDMILAGFTPDELEDIITKNTFVNLQAKVEFIKWKKVELK